MMTFPTTCLDVQGGWIMHLDNVFVNALEMLE